jgi:hypothetical protein
MKGFFRKLRGIIGTGITWAVGWGAIFGGIWIARGNPLGMVVEAVLGGAFLGACAGGSFAVILSLAERRRTLRELSIPRVAIWGGIGGMALLLALSPLAAVRMLHAGIPLVAMMSFVAPMVISGVLGAGFAAGSVALAKREERNEIGSGDPGGLALPEG